MSQALVADVAIAGGGLAGLACAATLAGEGLRVLVFEREGRLGGRASSWFDEKFGQHLDIGPHVVSTEHVNFLALLESVGTAGRIVWQQQPLITLLDAGHRVTMRGSRLPPPMHGMPNIFAALRCVSMSDLFSCTRVAWQAARIDDAGCRALDAETAYAWLTRMGVSERMIDWFWRSSILALLNQPLERCSAGAAMRVFRLMLGRSGYFFGFADVGLAELYVPGCVRLITGAGGAVRTNCGVRDLLLQPDGVRGLSLEDGTRVEARHVVVAMNPASLAGLDAFGHPALLEISTFARQLRAVPYVSTHLLFDQKLGPDRFWARVASPQDLNTDFYDLSNIRRHRMHGPSWIAANAIDATEACRWSDEHIIAKTVKEIVEFHPEARTAHVVEARIHRIPMAIPASKPGVERRRPRQASPLPGLWTVGDWTDTGIPFSMESATRSAFLAADELLQSLGRPARNALPAPETFGLPGLLRRISPGSSGNPEES